MSRSRARRAAYRVGQFLAAVASYRQGLDPDALRIVRAALPAAAFELFARMPRPDQRHAYHVMCAIGQRGRAEPDVLQAALLHDVAKHLGGVTLLHRVAVVLIKAFAPALWRKLGDRTAPARSHLLYPLWAHAHHPEMGAELAGHAGCDPLAVWLIRHHQDAQPADPPPGPQADHALVLLRTLRAADDDN